MRKPAKQGADQLHGDRAADQGLCLSYLDRTISLVSLSEILRPLAIFCGYSARFVSTLIENMKTGFHVMRLKFKQSFLN